MTNPLLSPSALPDFDAIEVEHISPAVDYLLQTATQILQRITEQTDYSWDTVAAPLENALDDINNAWSAVSHLNSVTNTAPLRDAYEENQQKLTDFYTKFGQNKALYQAYQAVRDDEQFGALPQAQQKAVENSIRSFVLSGVALNDEPRARYAEIQQRLSTLSTQFSNNVLDATQGWTLHITDKAELDGAPEFIINDAAERAKQKSLEGYVLTLDLPVYFTVISQVKSSSIRKTMYEAYVTRASNEGPAAGKWNNDALLEEIMALRQESAQLVGFKNYTEYSLAPKMADSPEQVLNFLNDLAQRAKPQAEQELHELREFARKDYDVNELNAWDIPYFSEQLKLKQHAVSQELLRPYFPTDTVLTGLFRLVEKLFAIEVKEQKTSVWHEAVRFFDIYRQGKKIASFYMDLYAREGKRGGAWMADCRVRTQKPLGEQLPVAFLVCNFSAPAEGKKAQLTHSEVTTLFHEFGHGIHHMLTAINTASVSGINGVSWDAVELPSQFMENFCWQEEVLAFISGHVETGEPLPEALLNNMLAAKNFQTAMMMLRQIEFSIFDLRLHAEYSEGGAEAIQKLLDEVRAQVSVWMPPSFNKFQNGFTHIFAGGYAAGYYSYKWAELLSADAFSLFEEEGLLNAVTGDKFYTEILSRGGSEDAAVLFERFRGRGPNLDALLRHSGIAA